MAEILGQALSRTGVLYGEQYQEFLEAYRHLGVHLRALGTEWNDVF